jgi:hypothetical protein
LIDLAATWDRARREIDVVCNGIHTDPRTASTMAMAAEVAKQIAKKFALSAQATAKPKHAIVEIRASSLTFRIYNLGQSV